MHWQHCTHGCPPTCIDNRVSMRRCVSLSWKLMLALGCMPNTSGPCEGGRLCTNARKESSGPSGGMRYVPLPGASAWASSSTRGVMNWRSTDIRHLHTGAACVSMRRQDEMDELAGAWLGCMAVCVCVCARARVCVCATYHQVGAWQYVCVCARVCHISPSGWRAVCVCARVRARVQVLTCLPVEKHPMG